MKHLIVAVASALLCTVAAAEPQWPDRPVKLVVGYSAGGPTDVAARALAEALKREIGVPVLVDNRPGAGTGIAAEAVAHAKPDGYTFLFGGFSQILLPYVSPVRFHPVNDLAAVSRVWLFPQVLAARADLPVKDVRELVTYARANPGKLNVGVQGQGSVVHYVVEELQDGAKVQFNPVFYGGSSQLITDLLAGRVDLMFDSYGTVEPYLKAGKMRVLGATTPSRSTVINDVPTVREQGVDKFGVAIWGGVFAPKGTPADVINRLNAAIVKVSADPVYASQIGTMRLAISISTPAEFASQVQSDYETMGAEIKRIGMDKRWKGQ
jgi:tripartite-type tricarboxylate transporter receptor subunit TctC